MLDPKKMLDDLMGTKVPGSGATVRDGVDRATEFARENPLAAGAIAAVLLGTRPGRRITGSALKLGGLAAIAGLAYKAWQSHQRGDEPGAAAPGGEVLQPPEGGHFDPAAAPQGESQFALMLVRAMVAAANADGHIDEAERAHITEKLAASGLAADATDFIAKELAAPAGIDALAASAANDAQKAELYAAARLAVSSESDAERNYLKSLADRLGLEPVLVAHIDATVEGVSSPA